MKKGLSKLLSKLGMHEVPQNKEIDLVCGMEVSKASTHTHIYNSKTYYFCSSGCQTHFVNDPEKYVGE